MVLTTIVLVCTGAFFGSQNVFSDSISVSVSSNLIELDAIPDTLVSNAQTVSVSTTSNGGYVASLATSGSSTALVHGSSNSVTIPTFTLPSGSSSIPLASLGNGYGFSLDNGLNWYPAPDPSGSGIQIDHTLDAGSNSYSLVYGAKVPTGSIAGAYTNTFQIYAVANPELLIVSYNSNGGSFINSSNTNTVRYSRADSTTVFSGTYATPTPPSGKYFYGWGSSSSGPALYGDENEVETNMPGNNGDTVNLYAIYGDCPLGKICYDGNGASSGTMGQQTVDTSTSSVTFLESNFRRSGYGFLGWSTVSSPTIGTDLIYGPNESTSEIDFAHAGLKLYAVWKEAETMNNNSPIYLQSWAGCNNLTPVSYNSSTGQLAISSNSVIVLTDERDGQVYTVARLADENCWIVENLRLENNGTIGSTNQGMSQGYGGVFAGLASPESANFSSSAVANSLYYSGTQSGTATIDIGTNDLPGYRIPRYRNTNTSSPANNPSTNSANIYYYGNYYTWSAAMASTEYYGVNSDNAGTSICPSGWSLPLGPSGYSTNLTYAKLDYRMGGTGTSRQSQEAVRNFTRFPNNFVYAGNARNNRIDNRSSLAIYWARSTNGPENGFILYLARENDYIHPGTIGDVKYGGASVRCVIAP